MDKVRISAMLIMCVLIFFTASIVGDEERKPTKGSLTERLTSLLYVSSPTTTTSSPEATTTWDRLKSLVKHGHAYFFRPNLE